MGWPQITLIVLMTLSVSVHLMKDGETTKYSFFGAVFGTAINLMILIKGGFFG